jgi:TorA maturation chaperone TorD
MIQSDPQREWLQSLIDQDVFSESPLESNHPDFVAGLHLLQTWAQESKEGISDQGLTDLKADYIRLFVGVGKTIAPPWESVHLNENRMIFQEQTLQVREWYRRFGVESENLYREPDDHIGLELAFLAHLAQLGLQALEENDEIKFGQTLQAQRQFISEHPLKWAPSWCELVEENAKTDFYRGLAKIISGTLFFLAESLEVQKLDVKTP